MNINKVLIIVTIALFSSSTYASIIKNISSDYRIEAGGIISTKTFAGDYIEGSKEKITETQTGSLFSPLSELGIGGLYFKGHATKYDEYGFEYSISAFADYTSTVNSLTFVGYGGIDYDDSDLLYGSSFLQSELDWTFRLEGGDALLNYVFITQSGKYGKSSLFDETEQQWIFDSGELGYRSGFDGQFTLELDHEYTYSNIYITESRNREGYINMRFESIAVPSPASLGIFGLALLGVFGLRKRAI